MSSSHGGGSLVRKRPDVTWGIKSSVNMWQKNRELRMILNYVFLQIALEAGSVTSFPDGWKKLDRNVLWMTSKQNDELKATLSIKHICYITCHYNAQKVIIFIWTSRKTQDTWTPVWHHRGSWGPKLLDCEVCHGEHLE